MSKLHAQMALLGRIDELVCDDELQNNTVKMIESFLPGTTGVGQRGWYGELKHFLQNDALKPRDPATGDQIERTEPVTFPTYGDALDQLKAQPDDQEKPAGPGTYSRAMYACTILSVANHMEGGSLPPPPGWNPRERVPDPLDEFMPIVAGDMSAQLPPMPGITGPPNGDPVEALKDALRATTSRADYANVTQTVAKAAGVDPVLKDIMSRPVVCTGSLRKIDGKYATLLTTSWDTPFTLADIKKIIDPLNWPKLCDFFVSMVPQEPLTPDTSGGWSRVLESVSGDKKQWQMQTALRYWKGVSTPGDGIYVNYDLDDPRKGDCKLVEVDAGYIWATPLTAGDENSLVRLRTCKQVRIRGVSPTATAALGCGFGWGDAMSQMFKKAPPPGNTVFAVSEEPKGGVINVGTPKKPDPESDEAIAAAAEEVELIKGWRGAIIKAMSTQLSEGIDKAKEFGTDFAIRWSDGDGLSLEDVQEFGKRAGDELTAYGTGIFKEAAAALQPQPNDAGATEGNA